MFCAVQFVRSESGELPKGLTEEEAEHVFMGSCEKVDMCPVGTQDTVAKMSTGKQIL